jgi:hypothetical protein
MKKLAAGFAAAGLAVATLTVTATGAVAERPRVETHAGGYTTPPISRVQ